jgi:membrane protein implicated in regulation of membrane protease activity
MRTVPLHTLRSASIVVVSDPRRNRRGQRRIVTGICRHREDGNDNFGMLVHGVLAARLAARVTLVCTVLGTMVPTVPAMVMPMLAAAMVPTMVTMVSVTALRTALLLVVHSVVAMTVLPHRRRVERRSSTGSVGGVRLCGCRVSSQHSTSVATATAMLAAALTGRRRIAVATATVLR